MNYIRRAGCPHPAASSRGYPSKGSHPRRGRRPRRPGNLLPPPIPGKTSGPGMPGPYRAAAGKPPAVRKRPRRGQDPSLRTAPSTSALTPPQVRAATRQRAATHVGGGVPDAPETSRHRPSPGKPPGRACPAPTARRWASPMPSINAHGGVKTPPYEPTHQRVPAPPPQVRAATRQRATTHVGGGVLDAPETSRHRPSPGKPPGRACPAPTARQQASPYAVRKRPRRGQDPSLRTDPSTNARIPPQVRAATRQRAAHPRRGRRPRRPGNSPAAANAPGGINPSPTANPSPVASRHRPSPGKPSGSGMPGPYRAAVGKPHAVHKRPRRGQDPSLRTAPSTSARTPYRAAARERRQKTEAIPFPGTASVLYISI